MSTFSEVYDVTVGRTLQVNELLSQSEEFLFKLRNELERCIQTGTKKLVCPICHECLKLKGGTPDRRLYFSHLIDSPDCPIKTTNRLTEQQIRILKYNGEKESIPHQEMKAFIVSMLELDRRFSGVKAERNFVDLKDKTIWRRPDVQAAFQNRSLVFEIQLNTTFLSVVVGRELFYERNNTFVIWVFKDFSSEEADLRFTEKDIFFNNNQNAFVLDDDSRDKSIESSKLFFKVYYREVQSSGIERIRSSVVGVDELTFDEETMNVFYYDTDSERKKVKTQMFLDYRSSFVHKFIKNYAGRRIDTLEFARVHKTKFEYFGIDVDFSDRELLRLISIICSLKHGHPVGFKFANNKEVVNHVLQQVPEFIWVLRACIDVYDHFDKFDHDHRVRITELLNSRTRLPEKHEFDRFIKYVFPELRSYIEKATA